jgi:hypothetical protein
MSTSVCKYRVYSTGTQSTQVQWGTIPPKIAPDGTGITTSATTILAELKIPGVSATGSSFPRYIESEHTFIGNPGGNNTISVYLPPLSSNKGRIICVHNTGSTGTIMLTATGSNTIDGASSGSVGSLRMMTVYGDDTEWTTSIREQSSYTLGSLGTGTADIWASPTVINHVQSIFSSIPQFGTGSITILADVKATSTNGGGFTSGAWRTRTLNTVLGSTGSVSLSSNQFTLSAGTYYINAFVPGYRCNNHQAMLYNITDSSTGALGVSSFSTSNAAASLVPSFISTVITIPSSKVFEIQHRCSSTRDADGFGLASGFGSEVYTTVSILRIS